MLILSGVGDPRHLKSLDIESNAEILAVGKSLGNHPIVPIGYGTNTGKFLAYHLYGWKKYRVGLQWLLFKTGIGATNSV